MATLQSKLGSGGLRTKLAAMAPAGAPHVSIGFLSDSKKGKPYPDGTSIPLVAYINEYGAPSRGQPPRPFFRRMIAEKKGGWGDAIALNYKATGGDVDKTLGNMGQGIVGQLEQSIRDLVDPPLAASTIKRKGFSKPLIDTNIMISNVDYRVDR